MKKSIKGFKISMIKIGKDGFIEVCNSEGELIKTTREQRHAIMEFKNNKAELIEAIKKTFNSKKIVDDDLIINIDK